MVGGLLSWIPYSADLSRDATNILNLYASSLAALTIGVRAARWKST